MCYFYLRLHCFNIFVVVLSLINMPQLTHCGDDNSFLSDPEEPSTPSWNWANMTEHLSSGCSLGWIRTRFTKQHPLFAELILWSVPWAQLFVCVTSCSDYNQSGLGVLLLFQYKETDRVVKWFASSQSGRRLKRQDVSQLLLAAQPFLLLRKKKKQYFVNVTSWHLHPIFVERVHLQCPFGGWENWISGNWT